MRSTSLLHFEHVAFVVLVAEVAPVVRAWPALDHHGDHRRDRVRGRSACRARPAARSAGTPSPLAVAVQQVQHGIARRASAPCAAAQRRRHVHVEGALALQRNRAVGRCGDRAAGVVDADAPQRRRTGSRLVRAPRRRRGAGATSCAAAEAQLALAAPARRRRPPARSAGRRSAAPARAASGAGSAARGARTARAGGGARDPGRGGAPRQPRRPRRAGPAPLAEALEPRLGAGLSRRETSR